MSYHNKLKKAIEELEKNNDISLIAHIDRVVDYLNKAINNEAKQYTTSDNKQRENIKATINNIYKNTTKNGKDYLLIKTDGTTDNNQPLAIFCFRLSERWGELDEGSSYNFSVERGERGSYILTDFVREFGEW